MPQPALGIIYIPTIEVAKKSKNNKRILLDRLDLLLNLSESFELFEYFESLEPFKSVESFNHFDNQDYKVRKMTKKWFRTEKNS